VGVNLRGHIVVDEPDKAKIFIQEHFILQKTWENYKERLTDVAVNLSYRLKHSQFNISINTSAITDGKQAIRPVVLFTGNFHHDLTTINKDEKLATLCEIVMNWQNDMKIFEEFIENIPE